MTTFFASLKSIVSLVGTIATALLAVYTSDTTVGQILTVVAIVATAVSTWVVPNLAEDPVTGTLTNVRNLKKNQRGATNLFFAAAVALGFLAIVFAVALLTGAFASPVGWVGVVVLAALAIFLYYLGAGRTGRGPVV